MLNLSLKGHIILLENIKLKCRFCIEIEVSSQSDSASVFHSVCVCVYVHVCVSVFFFSFIFFLDVQHLHKGQEIKCVGWELERVCMLSHLGALDANALTFIALG